MDDRIEADDGVDDIITKITEGNPGAITALSEVLNERGVEDFHTMALRLDLCEIYGPAVWEAFSDYCEEDADRFYDVVLNETQELQDFLE